jgi:hypothetical protein
MNPRGDLCVAQALPPKSELARMQSGRWGVAIATASAFAPVAAWPTTLGNIVLYNGEPGGGKSYLIDTVWAVSITSLAAASSFSLLAQVSNVGVAAPTDDTAQLITSLTGSGAYGGRAKRAVANTAFALTNKWDVLEVAGGLATTTTIGAGVKAEVYGGIILPPAACLAVNVVASTAAGTTKKARPGSSARS